MINRLSRYSLILITNLTQPNKELAKIHLWMINRLSRNSLVLTTNLTQPNKKQAKMGQEDLHRIYHMDPRYLRVYGPDSRERSKWEWTLCLPLPLWSRSVSSKRARTSVPSEARAMKTET